MEAGKFLCFKSYIWVSDVTTKSKKHLYNVTQLSNFVFWEAWSGLQGTVASLNQLRAEWSCLSILSALAAFALLRSRVRILLLLLIFPSLLWTENLIRNYPSSLNSKKKQANFSSCWTFSNVLFQRNALQIFFFDFFHSLKSYNSGFLFVMEYISSTTLEATIEEILSQKINSFYHWPLKR